MSAARKLSKAKRLRAPRAEAVGAAAAVAMFGATAFLAIQFVDLSRDLDTANVARDALARQVQQMGGTPVAGSPGSRGSTGPAGEKGEKGDQGVPGKPAPTLTPSPGPSGASGAPGRPGADSTVPGPSGSPGQPGADSTVPGPSGAPGADGRDGADGKDGSPPAGWTYKWTDPYGVTHNVDCGRADDFDPNDPRYTCADSSTPTPSPSPSPDGPLSLGVLVSMAAYRWRL
jgi:hypothetical protein